MSKAPRGRPQTEPDNVDRLLLDLATGLLTEYFFDPDNESRYLKLYPSRKALHGDGPLAEETLQQGGVTLRWQLQVLSHRNGFRITMQHSAFTANVEGIWQFEREILRQGQIIQRTGTPRRIGEAAKSLLETLLGSDPTEEELNDLLAALADDKDASLIGDNPEEPPSATRPERDRARSLVGQLARKANSELRMEDRMWLETTPQTLPVLTELLVEAMTAKARSQSRVTVCLDLVTLQLEFVRYRLDRGWDWAAVMLSEYQQRLIALGKADALDPADWFAMAGALTQARVPISDAVQLTLADAGLTKAPPAAPPEQLLAALRGLSDELASMVGSPFEVIESLNAAGAVMPATLRGFMATELALSSHAVLQQAVPLMLLDADPSVRRAAAAAIEQTAATVSPDSLRRAITVRNWIPQADRADLDRAIRKARSAGVSIGVWPSAQRGRASASSGDIAFHASMVDGSGAQSILAVSRSGRKGLVGGLLLRHGAGVQDSWIDPAVTRGNINEMLRDLKSQCPCDEVDKSYVDVAVQHAIATGLAHGVVPGEKVLAIAEYTGGAEWKDRRLDVVAESKRLFDGLGEADKRPEDIQAALDRSAEWMLREPIASSWFEDSKDVRQVIAKVPRKDNATATRLVLSEILPTSRAAWAERFLMMALWCQAATTQTHRAWAADFVILTHTLAGDVPLETIPIMDRIAVQTVMAARTSGW